MTDLKPLLESSRGRPAGITGDLRSEALAEGEVACAKLLQQISDLKDELRLTKSLHNSAESRIKELEAARQEQAALEVA